MAVFVCFVFWAFVRLVAGMAKLIFPQKKQATQCFRIKTEVPVLVMCGFGAALKINAHVLKFCIRNATALRPRSCQGKRTCVLVQVFHSRLPCRGFPHHQGLVCFSYFQPLIYLCFFIAQRISGDVMDVFHGCHGRHRCLHSFSTDVHG